MLVYSPTTLNLKTHVHTRLIGRRPFVELEGTESRRSAYGRSPRPCSIPPVTGSRDGGRRRAAADLSCRPLDPPARAVGPATRRSAEGVSLGG
ncbi:hypothetical protein [Streptomyces sp. MB09-01]|uniref:hypothetical protein n=1 Tax=Streptomyces sp. MB09-01 TaxID=3028666 RepID=UPI003A5BABC4